MASGYPTPIDFHRLTGCQRDPRDKGFIMPFEDQGLEHIYCHVVTLELLMSRHQLIGKPCFEAILLPCRDIRVVDVATSRRRITLQQLVFGPVLDPFS